MRYIRRREDWESSAAAKIGLRSLCQIAGNPLVETGFCRDFLSVKAVAGKPTPSAPGGVTHECLRDALGNAALEGQTPQPEDLADLEEVIAGRMSGEDYLARIKARYVVPA